MIYCGYQGCGKSTYCRTHVDIAIDLDSSMFKKYEGWEIDYIIIAKTLSNLGKKIFISAHKEVIQYLLTNKIEFELILPISDKNAWRSRLEFRYNLKPTQGNMNAIFDFDKNYEGDIAFYESIDCIKHYVLAHEVLDKHLKEVEE